MTNTAKPQHLSDYRALRVQAGLTIETVAELLGLTKQAVSAFERQGACGPRIDTLARYLVAIDRVDLANRLMPFLNEKQAFSVANIHERVRQNADGLRAAQAHGPHRMRR